MQNKGSLLVISAPSGAGKTSLVKALLQEMKGVCISMSYTTRAMRPGEQNEVDYHFVQTEEFEAMIKKNEFLEHAKVFGNYYGTARQWVENARNQGLDVILEIDWQGAQQVREQFIETESIFILPLSLEVLFERLQKRHPDNIKIAEARMKEAKDHISHYSEYDYLIFNDQFDRALEDLKAIIQGGRLRLRRQQELRKEIIKKLLS